MPIATYNSGLFFISRYFTWSFVIAYESTTLPWCWVILFSWFLNDLDCLDAQVKYSSGPTCSTSTLRPSHLIVESKFHLVDQLGTFSTFRFIHLNPIEPLFSFRPFDTCDRAAHIIYSFMLFLVGIAIYLSFLIRS